MAGEERRQHARIDARLPVQIGDHARGETENISEGGIAIVLGEGLERGSKIPVKLLDEDESDVLATTATVMWSARRDSGDYVAGLRFEGASNERLKALLARLEPDEDG